MSWKICLKYLWVQISKLLHTIWIVDEIHAFRTWRITKKCDKFKSAVPWNISSESAQNLSQPLLVLSILPTVSTAFLSALKHNLIDANCLLKFYHKIRKTNWNTSFEQLNSFNVDKWNLNQRLGTGFL